MESVHVFVSTGRFSSLKEMRAFIDQTYTEDGEGVPSPFMREVGLSGYEPGCIEVVHRRRPVKLSVLLRAASYAGKWVSKIEGGRLADSAACVYPPNRVRHPRRSSLEYVGAFRFEVVQEEWFKRLLGGE